MTFRMSLQDDGRWFEGESIWVTAGIVVTGPAFQ